MKARTRRMHYIGWILGSFAVAVALAYAFPARAHGLYAWINDGGYKGTDGLHCCGWQDCMEIRAGDATPTPDGQGYSTPRGVVGNKGVYHSRDGRTWICRYQGGPPKCLFIPGGG